MGVVKNLLIRGGADFSNIYKQTAKLQNTLSNFDKGLKALGIGASIAAIGHAIKTSTKNAMDAIEDQSLINTVFGENSAAVKEWAGTLQSDLGISGRLLQKNAATIYNISKSMGMGSGSALDMSKGVAMLAEDMASFYNLDSDEAFTKLRSGLTGETEPLKQLGIMVDQNTLKMYGFSENMSNAEKVAVRYKAILAQTATAQGDLARTINSPANQLRILKTNLQELSIAFGNIFIPILQAILPPLNSFVLILTQACNKISDFMYLLMGMKKTDNDVGNVTSTVSGLGDNLDSATSSAKKLKGQLAGFDEINKLGIGTDGGSGGGGYSGGSYSTISTSSGLLNQEAEKLTDDKLKGVRDILVSILETLATIKLAGGIWKMLGLSGESAGLIGGIGAIFAGLSNALSIPGVMNFAVVVGSEIVYRITDWLKKHMPKRLFEAIDQGIAGAFIGAIAGSWIPGVGTLVGAIVGAIIGALNGAFPEIGEAFVYGWNKIFNFDYAFNIFDNMKKHFSKAFSSNNFWDIGVNIILGIGEGIWGAIAFLLAPIVNLTNWIIDGICSLFGIHSPATKMMPIGANIVYGLIEGFKSAIQSSNIYQLASSIMTQIKSGLSSGWNNLKSWWSSLSLSSFKIKMPHLSWGTGGPQATGWAKKILEALSLPTSLPKLNVSWYAKGGIFDSPSVIGVGEAGKEAVVPLERNIEWINMLAEKISSQSGGGRDVNLYLELHVGDAKFGKACARAINKAQAQEGRILLEL